MKKSDAQQHFVMRNVTVSEMEQFYDLLNYVFQVTNTDIKEIGDDFLKNQKRPLLTNCDVIGWFDKNKLASQLMIYPFEVNIHGTSYTMGGITGVGTYPEYAGHGLIQSLMQEALQRMRAQGQSVSYLYPYSIPFYRKKGWEIISDKIHYKIRDTQLPKVYPVPGRSIRVEWGHPDMLDVYDRFAKKTNGAMIRGTLAWDERFRWERHELSFAVYYHSDTEPSGYLCYKVEDETYYVMEMVYLDNEARQGLWNFIHAHFSMVYHVEGQIFTNEPIAFLLEDGEIEQHIAPYYMARIVDVEQFLMKYPFAAGSTGEMVLGIQDPMASWNHDTFVIRLQAGQSAVITREKRAYDVLLDIQTLTTMMLSYKRPRYLNEVGRLHASKEVLECLEKWIPADQPWFADYF